MPVSIHIDGGARGNPGPAACGVVIRDLDADLLLHEAGYFLGVTTNNEAEYQGLLHGGVQSSTEPGEILLGPCIT